MGRVLSARQEAVHAEGIDVIETTSTMQEEEDIIYRYLSVEDVKEIRESPYTSADVRVGPGGENPTAQPEKILKDRVPDPQHVWYREIKESPYTNADEIVGPGSEYTKIEGPLTLVGILEPGTKTPDGEKEKNAIDVIEVTLPLERERPPLFYGAKGEKEIKESPSTSADVRVGPGGENPADKPDIKASEAIANRYVPPPTVFIQDPDASPHMPPYPPLVFTQADVGPEMTWGADGEEKIEGDFSNIILRDLTDLGGTVSVELSNGTTEALERAEVENASRAQLSCGVTFVGEMAGEREEVLPTVAE